MYILFDVGATKTRIAATRDRETFTEPTIVRTPKSFDEFKATFVATAREHGDGEVIDGAVGGMTGALDKTRGVIVHSPHLPDWNGRAVADELGSELAAQVTVENDSAVVGLGEAVYGAGKGHRIVSYVTVSTGVGGARMIDGRIDESAYGFEPGHQIVDLSGTLEEDNAGGTLEGLISGTALANRYGKAAADIHEPEVWETLAERLAVGLYNLSLVWSPEVIVLGGSMITGDPAIDVAATEAPFRERITRVFPTAPEIKKAELGDINGVWGALAYLNASTEL
ncbi:MAG: ROK family protein [Candidatus Paceibacterota bacterium]